jgi:phage-related protein
MAGRGDRKPSPFNRGEKRSGVSYSSVTTWQFASLPESRPMPSIGQRCHEFRISDVSATWRIVYRIDPDALVLLEIFAKKTQKTPMSVIETCKKRIRDYES